jgi:hypothetical protein
MEFFSEYSVLIQGAVVLLAVIWLVVRAAVDTYNNN